MISVFALLAAVNWGFWTRQVKFHVLNDPRNMRPWTSDRMAAIERGRAFLMAHRGGNALVEGNLVPRLVVRPYIYQVAGPHDRARLTFRYVFIEKPPHGLPWPVGIPEIERLLAEWRAAPGSRVIIDDEHVFLAEGTFHDLPP